MSKSENIRNVAIIAHVDHGKTTLVDQLLKQSGTFRENQVVDERVMDSMDLEKEKGITIKSKNTSVHWKEYTINIVDTPGHADFGGEVERVMKMVDGVLLVVDAHEGPQAQTRFVLRKALQEGLKPIVVINKIDRPNCTPEEVHDKVLELFLELGANEDQFNAPFVYGSAKSGFAVYNLEDEPKNMDPLFETIVKSVSPPEAYPEQPFRMLVSNIDWNDYVGRIAVGKVLSGEVKLGNTLYIKGKDGHCEAGKVTKVFEYSGLGTQVSVVGGAGNIVGVAGFESVGIGETLCADKEMEPLPFVEIDPPTVQMLFAVNDGPLAGREGKYVTSRQIRERLVKEGRSNVSLRIEDAEDGGTYYVSARGAMQIAVLVETMRREGYEILVSRPTVIMKKVDGETHEPFETAWVEVPETVVGSVMQILSERKGRIEGMETHKSGVTLEVTIPTRGLIGFEISLMNLTSGQGVYSHLFKEYAKHAGKIVTRQSGTLVSMDTGSTTAYALDLLEARGKLFVGPGEEVYEGMIVGENPRSEDLPVNPTKMKQLSNVRSSGEGKGIQLAPPTRFSLERAIEYIEGDEFVEATPKSLRLRKRILNFNERLKQKKRESKVEG